MYEWMYRDNMNVNVYERDTEWVLRERKNVWLKERENLCVTLMKREIEIERERERERKPTYDATVRERGRESR